MSPSMDWGCQEKPQNVDGYVLEMGSGCPLIIVPLSQEHLLLHPLVVRAS